MNFYDKVLDKLSIKNIISSIALSAILGVGGYGFRTIAKIANQYESAKTILPKVRTLESNDSIQEIRLVKVESDQAVIKKSQSDSDDDVRSIKEDIHSIFIILSNGKNHQ